MTETEIFYRTLSHRSKTAPVLTESLTDKKVKIGELVELGIAGEIVVT